MNDKIAAPFTQEQADALNRFQKRSDFHPFTCPTAHEERRDLVATTEGWVCPNCDYKQGWAHQFMLTEIPPAFPGDDGVADYTILPDGSACGTLSFPLPDGHWLFADGHNEPPAPYRMGVSDPRRKPLEKALLAAAKYAVRATTRNGKDDEWDPDAMVRNFVLGFVGYHTEDGFSRLFPSEGGECLAGGESLGPLIELPVPLAEQIAQRGPAKLLPVEKALVDKWVREKALEGESE